MAAAPAQLHGSSHGGLSHTSHFALYTRTSLATCPIEANYGALAVGVTEENAPSLLVQDIPSSPSSLPASDMALPVPARHHSEFDEDELINSLAAEIQECSDAQSLTAGEQIHARIIGCGLEPDRYLSNFLMSMYGNCGVSEAAEAVFLKIETPNVYSSNILINAYAKNCELDKAEAAFGDMSKWNVASWNAIISGLAKNGDSEGALHYYHKMLDEGFHPDSFTFVAALDACADVLALFEGLVLHCSITQYGYLSNMIVGTALVNMYGCCGRLDDAREVFRQIPEHDVTSCTAMISACVVNGCNEEALDMFSQMRLTPIKPTRATFLATLDACGKLTALSKGYEMHAFMLSDDIDSDIMVENALIDMYGKCQSVVDCIVVFDKMLQHNIVTWSTLLASHAGNRKNEEAVYLFYQMQTESIIPNNISFSVVIVACATTIDAEEGQRIHGFAVCCGVEGDVSVVIALINMYGKCQRLDDARAMFYSLEERGASVCNAMFSACVYNGHDEEARVLLKEMELKGLKSGNDTTNNGRWLDVEEVGWVDKGFEEHS